MLACDMRPPMWLGFARNKKGGTTLPSHISCRSSRIPDVMPPKSATGSWHRMFLVCNALPGEARQAADHRLMWLGRSEGHKMGGAVKGGGASPQLSTRDVEKSSKHCRRAMTFGVTLEKFLTIISEIMCPVPNPFPA